MPRDKDCNQGRRFHSLDAVRPLSTAGPRPTVQPAELMEMYITNGGDTKAVFFFRRFRTPAWY
jgi:hypothetical protein